MAGAAASRTSACHRHLKGKSFGMANTRQRILLMEDETFIATWIEDSLRGAGHNDAGHNVVGIAPCLAPALSLATTLDIDAAVLDINLKGELSFPVAEILRQRGITFMVCSSYTTTYCLPSVVRDAPTFNQARRRATTCHSVAGTTSSPAVTSGLAWPGLPQRSLSKPYRTRSLQKRRDAMAWSLMN
jgi:CheY-like chemotaxis protein